MRTWLFVPGHEGKRVAKAFGSDADAVIVDWEDAVPPEAKTLARQVSHEVLSDEHRPFVVLRVNGAESECFTDALEALAGLAIDAVMLPKAETHEGVERCAQAGFSIIALVESALGIERALEIARTPGVSRLAFGTLDFLADIGGSGSEALLYARSRLVTCSRAARLARPLDGVYPRLDDLEGLREEARLARRLGFGSKLLIHPKQIPVVREVFLPSEEELARARRILEAAAEARAEGRAALRLDGDFIDPPVVRWAEETLHAAEEEMQDSSRE